MRWLKAVFIFVAVAALVAAWFGFEWWREPKYQGKPVGYWFEEGYVNSQEHSQVFHEKARRALKEIGADALPFLLSLATQTDADIEKHKRWQGLFNDIRDELGFEVERFGTDIRGSAISAIIDLQPAASAVEALLAKPLAHPGTPEFDRAIQILGYYTKADDESALRYFTQALGSTNGETFAVAAQALAWGVGPRAVAGVPILVRKLEDPRLESADRAMLALVLGKIGSNSTPALPCLIHAFRAEPDFRKRSSIAKGIWMIDHRQIEQFDFLVNALTNQQSPPAQTRWVAMGLGDIGNEAKSAVPALRIVAESSDLAVWPSAINTLAKIGEPTNSIIAILRAKLNSSDPTNEIFAADQVLRLMPSDAQSLSVMARQVENHSYYQTMALLCLERAGTNSQSFAPAILRLFEGVNGTNTLEWMHAAQAFESIGPSAKQFLPQLRQKIAGGPAMRRFYVAEAIISVSPDDEAAQSVLIDCACSTSSVEVEAIQMLGRAGPAAKRALPMLREKSKSDNNIVREEAADAIEKIGAGSH